MFYGREYELKKIHRALRSKIPQLGIVYGRRRVGKSALLMKAGGSQRVLYFEGLQKASLKKQIDHFMSELARQTRTPKAVAHNWRGAFEVLSHYLKRGKHYVVFDEFPWMAAGRSELVSLLKFYWDNHWKKNPHLTLVLCGSTAQFMTKHLVHSQALHNRKTFEIKLEPLPACEAKLFFRGLRSDFEIAKFLMTFGGVPKYLEQVDPTRSLADNLDELCFQKDGFFLNEFESIFKEQFKVVKTYANIVRVFAEQSCSKEQLARRLKMKPGGGLSSYIQILQEADFVKIFRPLSLSGKGDKTRRIVLWDEWLRFYFNYMDRHLETIRTNKKPGLFNRLAGRSYDTWCGLAFEKLCMKNMDSILANLGIDSHLGFGPFFRQTSRKGAPEEGLQIDILVHRAGHVLTLIECKFRTQPVGISVVEEVERKVKYLKPPRHYTVERVLITSGGVTRDLEQADYFHRIVGLDSVLSRPR